MTEAVQRARRLGKGSVSHVCERFATKRNAYYKHLRSASKNLAISNKLLNYVRERRKEQPREGCRKIYKALQQDDAMHALKIGRDKLFTLLREQNMLVRKKRSFVKTTDSNHRFRKYENKIKDLQIVRPNQVWVSDITYIRMIHGHCYLALITDAYSRKIVGYDVSNSLELAGCLRAFKTAQRQARPTPGLIHHSDRGSQYCSNDYVGLLKHHKVEISMTQENHCYENAMAERVNGILKDEFYLDQTFSSLALVQKACANAIKIYNTKRLHLSLGYKTPEQVYKMSA